MPRAFDRRNDFRALARRHAGWGPKLVVIFLRTFETADPIFHCNAMVRSRRLRKQEAALHQRPEGMQFDNSKFLSSGRRTLLSRKNYSWPTCMPLVQSRRSQNLKAVRVPHQIFRGLHFVQSTATHSLAKVRRLLTPGTRRKAEIAANAESRDNGKLLKPHFNEIYTGITSLFISIVLGISD
jgi:hypothetical protein